MMIKKFGTITTEDELYFNTIRTIHSDCVEKVGMNKIQALLMLQLANGAAISFSHVNATGELGGGGVIDWLHAGMTNFQRRMRENARNSIMEVLFPDGVVFGSIGDGSNDRCTARCRSRRHLPFASLGQMACHAWPLTTCSCSTYR